MFSLKNGRVPVRTGDKNYPVVMFLFPSKKKFKSLYRKGTNEDLLEKYWEILSRRIKGYTLVESGEQYGLTRERVRQIEAKFIRLFGDQMLSEQSGSFSTPVKP